MRVGILSFSLQTRSNPSSTPVSSHKQEVVVAIALNPPKGLGDRKINECGPLRMVLKPFIVLFSGMVELRWLSKE